MASEQQDRLEARHARHLRSRGLDFLDSATWRFENVVELDAPSGEVFDIFADPECWRQWFEAVQRVVWTSPGPKGVGTTRTVTLAVTPLKVTVQERFLVWDPGQRFTFRFEGVSLPLFHAGIEDYRREDLSGGRCRLTYPVGLEPTAVVRLAGPVTPPLFARMLRTGPQGLQSYVAVRRRLELTPGPCFAGGDGTLRFYPARG